MHRRPWRLNLASLEITLNVRDSAQRSHICTELIGHLLLFEALQTREFYCCSLRLDLADLKWVFIEIKLLNFLAVLQQQLVNFALDQRRVFQFLDHGNFLLQHRVIRLCLPYFSESSWAAVL
jgi:hypothetical protein